MRNVNVTTVVYYSETVKVVRQVTSQEYLASATIKSVNDAAERLKQKALRAQKRKLQKS